MTDTRVLLVALNSVDWYAITWDVRGLRPQRCVPRLNTDMG